MQKLGKIQNFVQNVGPSPTYLYFSGGPLAVPTGFSKLQYAVRPRGEAPHGAAHVRLREASPPRRKAPIRPGRCRLGQGAQGDQDTIRLYCTTLLYQSTAIVLLYYYYTTTTILLLLYYITTLLLLLLYYSTTILLYTILLYQYYTTILLLYFYITTM